MKRILAALMFFTRLPLWKIAYVDKKYFERVVPLWPLVGWLTGGLMALVFWCATQCVASVAIAAILALISRVLLTGGLHEDGFADFCDGFGGGTSSERTLQIMKDSHIGTYGVLGLILYYLLLCCVITDLRSAEGFPFILIGADAFCKYVSSTIIYYLPYVRKEEESKNRLIYTSTPVGERIISCVLGVLPLAVIAAGYGMTFMIGIVAAICIAIITATSLFLLMKKRIGGYTGDCCGATFIITEAAFLLTLSIAS